MPIDWTATGEMIASFGSWAEAGAVAFAAYKAADTFSSWRLRRSTERKEDIAQRTLVAVFKVKEAFRSIRSPLLHGAELEAAGRELEENEGWHLLTRAQQEAHKSGQVYIRRMKYFDADFDELADCIPLARAILGDRAADALEELHRQLWALRVHVESYVDDRGSDHAFTIMVRQNLNDHRLTGDGAVTTAIKTSIATIQSICLPVLRA